MFHLKKPKKKEFCSSTLCGSQNFFFGYCSFTPYKTFYGLLFSCIFYKLSLYSDSNIKTTVSSFFFSFVFSFILTLLLITKEFFIHIYKYKYIYNDYILVLFFCFSYFVFSCIRTLIINLLQHFLEGYLYFSSLLSFLLLVVMVLL